MVFYIYYECLTWMTNENFVMRWVEARVPYLYVYILPDWFFDDYWWIMIETGYIIWLVIVLRSGVVSFHYAICWLVERSFVGTCVNVHIFIYGEIICDIP